MELNQNTQLQTLNSSSESETTNVDSEHRLSSTYQSPSREQLSDEQDKEARREREKASISAYFRIVAVWQERDATTKAHPQTHHYNWYGDPVYHPVGTSAAESLALILSTPKIPTGSCELRVRSILKRAVKLIDPVAVDLRGLDHDIWNLSGSELIQAARGRVCRLYSPHGTWVARDNEGGSVLTDSSDEGPWDETKVLIANGMVGNKHVPTWETLRAWKNQLIAQKSRRSAHKRSEWKPVKSLLHVMECSM